MFVGKIVLNASPLILLCNSKLDFVLPELFHEIVIPNAVWREIMAGPQIDRAVRQLPNLPWLKQISSAPEPDILRWDLGVGETEVLSFVFRRHDYTAVLDDLLAKKCASSLGLPTIGTGAI